MLSAVNSRGTDGTYHGKSSLPVPQGAQSHGRNTPTDQKAQPSEKVEHLSPMPTASKKRPPFLFPTSLEKSTPPTTARSTLDEVRQELQSMFMEMQDILSNSIKDEFNCLTTSLELGIQRSTKECFSELDISRPQQQQQAGSKSPPVEAKALDHDYAGAQAHEAVTLEKFKTSSLEAQVDALQAKIAVNRAQEQASGSNVPKAAIDELSAIETIKRVVFMEAQVEELSAKIAILKAQKQELPPQMESAARQTGPMEPKALSVAIDTQGSTQLVSSAQAFHRQNSEQSRQHAKTSSNVSFATNLQDAVDESEFPDDWPKRSTATDTEKEKWDILASLAETALVNSSTSADEEERQFALQHWQQQTLQRILTRRSLFWQCLTWAQIVDGEVPKEGPNTPLGRFVRGPFFGGWSMTVILANAAFIGYETDQSMRDALNHKSTWEGWFFWNFGFTLYFVLELLFRIFANRLWFFLCPEYKWNIFDMIIVICSIFTDMLANVNISFIRALRVFRIVRVARLVRVLKVFRNLRRVIFAIMACMESLAWCFLFLTMLVYMFSIFFLQGAADYVSHSPDSSVVADLTLWYGSLPEAMYSMLLSLTGGHDWQPIMEPLNSIGWYYAAAFPMSIVFVNIGVLNVLTGVFMENAAEATDRDMVVQRENARMEQIMEEMLNLFAEFDGHADGRINWTEFRTYMAIPHVQIYLAAHNLETSHARMLFHLLDEEGSGDIDIREFVIGLIRLSGDAKTVDVRIILHAMCKLVFNVEEVGKSIANSQRYLRDHQNI